MKRILCASLVLIALYSCAKHDSTPVDKTQPPSVQSFVINLGNSIINAGKVDSAVIIIKNVTNSISYFKKCTVDISAASINASFSEVPAGDYRSYIKIYQKDSVFANSQMVYSLSSSFDTKGGGAKVFNAPTSINDNSVWNILRRTSSNNVSLSSSGSKALISIDAPNLDDITNIQYKRTYFYFDNTKTRQSVSKEITLSSAQLKSMTINGSIVDSTDMTALLATANENRWFAMEQSMNINYSSRSAVINGNRITNVSSVQGVYDGSYSYNDPTLGSNFQFNDFLVYPDGTIYVDGDEPNCIFTGGSGTWTLTGNQFLATFISLPQAMDGKTYYFKADFDPSTGKLSNGSFYKQGNINVATWQASQQLAW